MCLQKKIKKKYSWSTTSLGCPSCSSDNIWEWIWPVSGRGKSPGLSRCPWAGQQPWTLEVLWSCRRRFVKAQMFLKGFKLELLSGPVPNIIHPTLSNNSFINLALWGGTLSFWNISLAGYAAVLYVVSEKFFGNTTNFPVPWYPKVIHTMTLSGYFTVSLMYVGW